MGMASNINVHCLECTTCQQAKLHSPTNASVIISSGISWKVLASDVLEVPLSNHATCYVLLDKTTNRLKFSQ